MISESVAVSLAESIPAVLPGQYRRVLVGAVHTLHEDLAVWVAEEGQTLSHTSPLCLPLRQQHLVGLGAEKSYSINT